MLATREVRTKAGVRIRPLNSVRGTIENAMRDYQLRMDDDGSVLRAEISGERSSLSIEMAQDMQVCWEAILWEAKSRALARVLVVSNLTGWVSTSAVIATVEFVRQIGRANRICGPQRTNRPAQRHRGKSGNRFKPEDWRLRR
jgi:hypothetical protein